MKPEFALIEWIKHQTHPRSEVALGIGDDAAGLVLRRDCEVLIATDMLLEGVHFEFSTATPADAGRKALAVNLSDIAAMGGEPIAAFVSVGLPKSRGVDFAKEVHRGILDLAREWNVCVAGGDTNSWDGPLVVNVALMGQSIAHKSVRRNGAKPGDAIFVTGELGGSLAGKHLHFTPRLHESAWLVQKTVVTAMIDISDGLAADLHHLLEGSCVGAVLQENRIPVSVAVQQLPPQSADALQHALADGEDFELLFTIPAEKVEKLTRDWPFATPLTEIGHITEETGCILQSPSGSTCELPPLGWGHSLG